MHLAVVDLGSNSFRLERIEVQPDGSFKRIGYWKEKNRLASGFNAAGKVRKEIELMIRSDLLRFRELLGGLPVSRVTVVATQAMRQARETEGFMETLEDALGYPIHILSGEEEAVYAYEGAMSTRVCAHGERNLVIDIGGASTEAAFGVENRPLESLSIPVGCVSSSMRYFQDALFSKASYEEALADVSSLFDELAAAYPRERYDNVFGVAGTFRAVLDVVHEMQLPSPAADAITREHVDTIKSILFSIGELRKLRVPGLRDERHDVIAGGIVVIEAVMNRLGIDALRFVEGGVRRAALLRLHHRVLEGLKIDLHAHQRQAGRNA